MKIDIKCRFSDSVLFSHECESNTIKLTLELAVKARANLYSANLAGANLAGADLYGANLSDANLYGANLAYANLYSANLAGANLAHANLIDASLIDANLYGANLAGANLAGADLADANLAYAYLYGANLEGANLAYANLEECSSYWSAIGNRSELKSMQCDTYDVTYTATRMQIGCQLHLISEWWGFDDDEISAMDSGALEWWRIWKPILQQIISISPAKSTKEGR